MRVGKPTKNRTGDLEGFRWGENWQNHPPSILRYPLLDSNHSFYVWHPKAVGTKQMFLNAIILVSGWGKAMGIYLPQQMCEIGCWIKTSGLMKQGSLYVLMKMWIGHWSNSYLSSLIKLHQTQLLQNWAEGCDHCHFIWQATFQAIVFLCLF